MGGAERGGERIEEDEQEEEGVGKGEGVYVWALHHTTI